MPTKSRDYRVVFKERGAQQLNRKMSGLDAGTSKLTGRLQSLGKAMLGAFAAQQVIQGIAHITRLSAEQEQIFKKLETSINIVGGSYDRLAASLNNYFAELQATTEFGDTDSAKTLTTLIQLTGNYEVALEALPATLDLAASGLFNLDGAARAMGMAMSGNVEMLGRYLPALKTTNPELKKLTTNAEKAALALDEVNAQFDGTAEENVKTYTGSITKLGNAFGDLLEEMGNVITKNTFFKMQIENSTKFILMMASALAGDDPKALSAAFDKLIEKLHVGGSAIEFSATKLIAQAAAAKKAQIEAAKLAETWAAVNEGMAAFSSPDSLVSNDLDMLVTQFKELEDVGFPVPGPEEFNAWDVIRDKISDTGDILGHAFVNQWREGENALESFAKAFKAMLEDMAAQILAKAAIFGILNLVTGGIAGGLAAFTGGKDFLPFIFGSGATAAPGGGGTTNVYNINALDGADFDNYLRHRGGAASINRILPEMVS